MKLYKLLIALAIATAAVPAHAEGAFWTLLYQFVSTYWFQIAVVVASVVTSAEQRRSIANKEADARAAYNAQLLNRNVTALSAAPPLRYVYGRCIEGGDLRAILTTDKSGLRNDGSSYTKPDGLKHMVVTIADHQVSGLFEVFINGVAIGYQYVDGNGWVTQGPFFTQSGFNLEISIAAGGNYTFGSPPTVLGAYVGGLFTGGGGASFQDSPAVAVSASYTIVGNTINNTGAQPTTFSVNLAAGVPSVRVSFHNGAAGQTVDTYLNGVAPNQWTSSHTLQGKAYCVVTLDLEFTTFQGGPPNITFDVAGKLLYDPRTTTTYFSSNPALVLRDFLTGDYGYQCTAALDVDDTYCIAAANACDTTVALIDFRGAFVSWFNLTSKGTDTNTDGWTFTGATFQTSESLCTITSTGTTPQMRKGSLSFSGSTNTAFSFRFRRLAGSGWTGRVYYTTGGHGESTSYYKAFSQPTYDAVTGWAEVTLDMSVLTAGAADWTSSTITGVRLDLGATASDVFAIDWITVGGFNAPQFACDGVFTTDQDKEQTIASIVQTMAGQLTYGAKWQMQAGVWTAPVMTLNDDDLMGQISVTQAEAGLDMLYNGVRGTYIAEDKATASEFDPYQVAAFVTADGAPLWQDIALPFTNHKLRARNLACVMVNAIRYARVIQYPAKLKAWPLQVGDRVQVNSAEYGFSGAYFRVTDWSFTATGAVVLGLHEDDPGVYSTAPLVTGDIHNQTTLPMPWIINALTGVSFTATGAVQSQGSLANRVVMAWATVTDASVVTGGKIIVKWRRVMQDPANVWQTITLTGDAIQAVINGVAPGDVLAIDAFTINQLGWTSPHYVTNYTVPTTLPYSSYWANAAVGANNMVYGLISNGTAQQISGPGTYQATNAFYLRTAGVDIYGLQPGDWLTVSADIWCDATAVAGGQMATIFLWAENNAAVWQVSAQANNTTTTKQRVSASMQLPASTANMYDVVVCLFHQPNPTGAPWVGNVYADRIQVERGHVATQYAVGQAPNATRNLVTYASSAPSQPQQGDIWIDTSTSVPVTKTWNSGAWVLAANLVSNTFQYRAVAFGNNCTTNPVSAGTYDATSGTLLYGAARSYHVLVYSRATGAVYSNTVYDVYASSANASSMASFLNSLSSAYIVAIKTYDEPSTNRMGMAPAMYRCGASRAVFGSPNFKVHSAYILIGIAGCGEGNGFEAYQGAVDNDSNAWCDVTYAINAAGNLMISGTSAVPRTLADYSYTGDLNAGQNLVILTQTSANVTIQGSSVSKTAGTTAWDAECYSQDGYQSGCYVSFVPTTSALGMMVGLSGPNPAGDVSYYNIKYCIYLIAGSSTFDIYESGTGVTIGIAYTTADTFAVTYDNQFVRYYHNGVVVRKVVAPADLVLFVDVWFYNSTAGFSNMKFGPMASTNIAASPNAAQGWALNSDPTCLDISAWSQSGAGATPYWNALSSGAGTGAVGPNFFQSAGSFAYLASFAVPISPGKKYRASCYAKLSPGSTYGRFYLRIHCFDSSGTQVLPYTLDVPIENVDITPVVGNWVRYQGTMTPAAGSVTAFVEIDFNYPNLSGILLVQDIRLEEVVNSDIVNVGAAATVLYSYDNSFSTTITYGTVFSVFGTTAFTPSVDCTATLTAEMDMTWTGAGSALRCNIFMTAQIMTTSGGITPTGYATMAVTNNGITVIEQIPASASVNKRLTITTVWTLTGGQTYMFFGRYNQPLSGGPFAQITGSPSNGTLKLELIKR